MSWRPALRPAETNFPMMRVLLVDDHSVVREGLRAVLRRLMPGASVAEAETAAQALAQATTSAPDLVLVDINLPGMSGLELLRRFHAAQPLAKLLVVAGEADPWTVHQALQAGAAGYLLKTNASDHLPQALQAVRLGKRFLSPEAAVALARAEEESGRETEPPGLAALSSREQQVLKGLARGQTTRAIALDLQVSPKTVETHRSHIMSKLRLDSVAALTRYAIRHGLLPL
jgi:DNA-binding NarL/FixJ family response regulator